MLDELDLNKMQRLIMYRYNINKADAEDAVANAVLHILTKDIELRSATGFLKICKNLLINEIKRRRTELVRNGRYLGEPKEEALSQELQLIDSEESDSRKYLLKKGLERLTEKQQKCVLMSVTVYGETAAANKLKMNINSYNTHRKRALMHLREYMRGVI